MPKANTTNDQRLKLIEALKFAAVAIVKDDNSGLSQFVAIRDHWLMAENDTFTVGTPIETDLEMCLHAEKFLAALSQCSEIFQMVQVNPQELALKSGAFRAVIPILASDTVARFDPDAVCGTFDDKLKEGFKIASKICTGKDDRSISISSLLRKNSIVATNGHVAIEYWHGFDFPKPMAIPKKTVEILSKIDKSLVGFGFSDVSLTFYFADMSFLKTRLVSATWPDLDKLFNDNTFATEPLWQGFAQAIDALNKFCDDDTVWFHRNVLSTHGNLEHSAASYNVPNLPGGLKFSLAYWRIILPYAKNISTLHADRGKPMFFTSDCVRGLLMGKS